MRCEILVMLPLVIFSGGLTAEEKGSATEGLSAPLDVYVSGVGGYHTYRIPSLLTTNKGTVLAFTEGRKTSRADLGDNDMLLRRSRDNGQSWLKTQLVYEEGGSQRVTIGNPTAVLDESTGIVWLAAKLLWPILASESSCTRNSLAEAGVSAAPLMVACSLALNCKYSAIARYGN